MSKIKIDTWYDTTCSCCARSCSTDFEKGMEASKSVLSRLAYKEGWKCRDGATLCPECAVSAKTNEAIQQRMDQVFSKLTDG